MRGKGLLFNNDVENYVFRTVGDRPNYENALFQLKETDGLKIQGIWIRKRN